MILHSDELSKLISGAVWLEKEHKQVHPWRFSRAHLARMESEPAFLYRAKASSGMMLDFETDSRTLAFTLVSEPAAGTPWFGLDIMVNDQLFHHVYNPSGTLTDSIHLDLPADRKRITIYLPNLCSNRIADFSLDDGSFWSAVPKKQKLLFLGDSITQGYVAEHPSRAYVHLLSRALDAECLNQAIGGAVYDADRLDDTANYQPDLIFTAYGTNDWNLQQDLTQNAEKYFQKLHAIYGNTPMYVLLPIWRVDCAEKESAGHEPFLHARIHIKDVCERYPNCHVLDTIDYIPHDPAYYHDHVHPNENGFARYADAILNVLKGQ